MSELLHQVAAHYNQWITVFLMVAGLYIVIARGNMVKKLIGLSMFQTSVYLLYISWFIRRGDRFEGLRPGEDGLYRSEIFPGLWLDPAAFWAKTWSGCTRWWTRDWRRPSMRGLWSGCERPGGGGADEHG